MPQEATIVSTCPFCRSADHDIEACDEAWAERVRAATVREEEETESARIDAAITAWDEAASELADEMALQLWEENGDDAQYARGVPPPGGERNDKKAKPGQFLIGDQTEVATRLIEKLTGKGHALVYDDGALHRYEPDDGLWYSLSENNQSQIIQAFSGSAILGEKKKVLRVGWPDVKGAMRLAATRMHKPAFFSGPHVARGIAFKNGFVRVVDVLGVKCLDLAEHSAANCARWGYTFDYNAKAEPKMFLNFLNAVWKNDDDKDAKIKFVQEFGGLTLLGMAPTFQKCLVASSFVSAETDGQNGKSQLAAIFEGIMPPGSVSATRPQDFDNEYRRAGLAGKLLNCVSEMPEGDILESASFKAIITGDKIEGRPIREAPFAFFPRAGHYYACNTPPGTGDFSKAFFRRFVFLTFSRVFRESDPDFVRDIGRKIVEAEREDLPSWFLQGALRALQQSHYTHVPSSDRAILEWRKGVDQVELFFNEMTAPARSDSPGKGSDWAEAFSLYTRYRQWAQDTGHTPMASNKFGARAKQRGSAPKRTKIGIFYPVRYA